MLLWIILAVVFFWFVGAGSNVLAWWTGKARLDVLTFAYLPIWSLIMFIPMILALVWSMFDVIGNPGRRWKDTWGARIALASLAGFAGWWIGSAMLGAILRYFYKWPDGPTIEALPKKDP